LHDVPFEAPHLLTHVGRAAQAERLGDPFLGLIGSAMQGPSESNALLAGSVLK
jgi:hypothetical protein